MGTTDGPPGERGSNRRTFLKATGIGVLGTTIAGCMGSGSQNNGGSNNSSNSGGGNGSNSKTTVTYASRGAAITATAKEQMDKWVSEFEKQNPDIQIKVNPTEGISNQQQKYRQMFQSGDLPVMFDIGPHDVGPFAKEKYFQPVGEWVDKIDPKIQNQVGDWVEKIEQSFGPTDIGDPNTFCYPAWQSPFVTMVGRRSHYKAAGLDPDKDFPPESYQEFRSQAKKLQKDAPSQYAVALSSSTTSTIQNGIGLWAYTADSDKGREFNTDWSEPYMGNDVWLKQTKRYVDTFQQDFTSPGSVGLGSQQAALEVAKGIESLTWVSNQLIPNVKSNAPEAFENGDMMFGLPWTEGDNPPGNVAPFFFWLTQQPDDVSDSAWKAKTDAAIKFMEFLLSKEKQKESIQKFGQYPTRADVASELIDQHGKQDVETTGLKIGQSSGYTWPAQYYTSLTYGDAPQIGQQAMQGQITPEEACEQWKQLAKDTING